MLTLYNEHSGFKSLTTDTKALVLRVYKGGMRTDMFRDLVVCRNCQTANCSHKYDT